MCYLSRSCWNFPLRRPPGQESIMIDSWVSHCLFQALFKKKYATSFGKNNIKIWTYWCDLIDAIIVLMEKAWTSCRRNYWAGQRKEEERWAAWKHHHHYNHALRREEVLALLGLICPGWNLILNLSGPQGKSCYLSLELTISGKGGSARQITDKRNNCIISIVPKYPCSHDNILRDLWHWQLGRCLISFQ